MFVREVTIGFQQTAETGAIDHGWNSRLRKEAGIRVQRRPADADFRAEN